MGHRVVVVGAGFAGLQLVQDLRGVPCRITLIDQRNHHLFQPLLYQVATTLLSTSEIAWPIRRAAVKMEADRRFDCDALWKHFAENAVAQAV